MPHGQRRSVRRGWCPFLPIASLEVLALRKGTACRGYEAFSVAETADPSGRGVLLHGHHFQDENEPGKLRDKFPVSIRDCSKL